MASSSQQMVNLTKTTHDVGNNSTLHTTFKVLRQETYTGVVSAELLKIFDEAQKGKKINM